MIHTCDFFLGWLEHKHLRINYRKEGFSKGVFGCRAGPYDNVNIDNLLHEIAHGIEFILNGEKRRICVYGFRFKLKPIEMLGRVFFEPSTNQVTKRECRAFAIQRFLASSIGHEPESYQSIENTAHYLPDYYMTGKGEVTKLVMEYEKTLTEENVKNAYNLLMKKIRKIHLKIGAEL